MLRHRSWVSRGKCRRSLFSSSTLTSGLIMNGFITAILNPNARILVSTTSTLAELYHSQMHNSIRCKVRYINESLLQHFFLPVWAKSAYDFTHRANAVTTYRIAARCQPSGIRFYHEVRSKAGRDLTNSRNISRGSSVEWAQVCVYLSKMCMSTASSCWEHVNMLVWLRGI